MAIKTAIGTKTAIKVAMEAAIHHDYKTRETHADFAYTISFDVTPHILRHTHITNLLLAGVDIKTVHYLAGHERTKITLDIYAHLTYNRPEEILENPVFMFSIENVECRVLRQQRQTVYT